MSNFSMRKFLNAIAYVAIIMCAIAVLLGWLIDGLGILITIAGLIALVITAICAFYYARSKRNPIFLISYIIAVVLIIVVNGILLF